MKITPDDLVNRKIEAKKKMESTLSFQYGISVRVQLSDSFITHVKEKSLYLNNK